MHRFYLGFLTCPRIDTARCDRIPVSAVLGFFFLGIEELAIQLEEPFSVLPLAQIAGAIKLSAEEHHRWMQWAMEQEEQETGFVNGFGFR